MTTHHEVLGVGAAATTAEVRAAWRDRALALRGGLGEHAAEFRRVRLAYEVLVDPARRQAYEAGLAAELAARVAPPTPPAEDPADALDRLLGRPATARQAVGARLTARAWAGLRRLGGRP